MTDFSIIASVDSIEETTPESPLGSIVLFSCVGLIASLCLMIFGVDLGAGWI
jgi:hypothetical protein